MVPFSIFWLGIVLSISLMTATGDIHNVDPMTYVILPVFVAVGLYMLVGRFLVDIYARRHTEYVLTDQRAIIASGIIRSTTRSVNLAAAAEIRYRQGRRGRGTIEFGSGGMFGMLPRSWPGASQFMPPAFDGIEDASRVYDLALNA